MGDQENSLLDIDATLYKSGKWYNLQISISFRFMFQFMVSILSNNFLTKEKRSYFGIYLAQ